MVSSSSKGSSVAREDDQERALIARVLGGERNLFYQLVEPHERSLYLTAWAILQNSTDAEDVVQEAVLKAFRHLSGFRGEAKFSTWLVRIVTNEARMRLRKEGKARFESLDTGDAPEDRSDYTPMLLADWRHIPSEVLENREVREAIAKALTALPETYREVLILRDVQQLNIAETAAALDITQGMVKIRLFRARLIMRDLLAPELRSRAASKRTARKGRRPWF